MAHKELAFGIGHPEKVVKAIDDHAKASEIYTRAQDELRRAVNGLVPMELETAIKERSLFFIAGDETPDVEGFDKHRYLYNGGNGELRGWMYVKKEDSSRSFGVGP